MDALPQFDLVSPRTLDDLIAARAAHPDSRVLGGGTDLLVNIRRGIVAPPVLIDINGVAELRAVKADAKTLAIGAAATLAEIAAHPDVVRHYAVVAQAAGNIAGATHRNMGTVGGNLALDTRCIFYNQSEWWRDANHHCLKTTGDICHVAPKSRGVCFATFSGDLAPALLVLDAEIDIAGPAGRRTIPLADLYIGYARQDEPVTATRGDGKYFLSLRPGEIITTVRAKNTPGLRSAYDKIRIRRSIEYPVTGVAVALRRDGDTLADLRVAEFVKDVVTAPDLAAYGLTTPTRQITLRAAAGGNSIQAFRVVQGLHDCAMEKKAKTQSHGGPVVNPGPYVAVLTRLSRFHGHASACRDLRRLRFLPACPAKRAH